MFTQAELLVMKKPEIMSIAKDMGIVRYKGSSERTKADIIENILMVQNEGGKKDEEATKETASVSDEKAEQVEQPVKKQSKVVTEVQKLKEKKPELSEEEKAEKKMSYIEGANVGTLVAFRTDNGKIKSAMIVKRSTKNRKFKLETKYGASFVVSFDDVVWVRTNKRWPKGVYQLLKGMDESEVSEDGREEVHS